MADHAGWVLHEDRGMGLLLAAEFLGMVGIVDAGAEDGSWAEGRAEGRVTIVDDAFGQREAPRLDDCFTPNPGSVLCGQHAFAGGWFGEGVDAHGTQGGQRMACRQVPLPYER